MSELFGHQLYPTPEWLARRMMAMVDLENVKYVLEPSAGRGDLSKVILDFLPDVQLDMVEIDADLCAVLRARFTMGAVNKDFLMMEESGLYDLVVMNPPFDKGVAHVIHALKHLRSGGQLVAILPANALNKDFAQTKILSSIVESCGGFMVNQGSAFADADRKTNVEIGILYIRKKLTQDKNFFEGADFGGEDSARSSFIDTDTMDIAKIDAIGVHDAIAGIVSRYELNSMSLIQFYRARDKVESAWISLGKYSDSFKSAIDSLPALDQALDKLRAESWDAVFRTTNAAVVMTNKLRKDFDEFVIAQSRVAFNEDNIYSVIKMLWDSRGDIMQDAVVTAFDHLTAYHKENRVHFEGWKTNAAYKVRRKFILPFIGDNQIWRGPKIHIRYDSDGVLDDLDKALCFLSGVPYDRENTTYGNLYEATRRGLLSGELVNTPFFEIKVYQKGTGHFTFKDKKLWEMFNQAAAKGKNWLPEEVRK